MECLFKNNPFFNINVTNKGEMHNGMSWHDGNVSPIKGCQVIENPLWCDDTLFID